MSQSTAEVGFRVKPLPLLLRVPTLLADLLGIKAPRLTPENITRAAAKAAGLPARFPSHAEEALERVCRSYHDDSKFHWFGRMNQWNLAVTGLSMLLKVEQAFKDNPELEETKLIPPLIVTGLPRSGTTFLHRLLSCPEDAKPISMMEHIHPVWKGPEALKRLDVELKFTPWKWASKPYGMDAIHFVRPTLADECNFGMRLAMRSMIYWGTAPTYSYLTWLLDQDLRESYQLYRRVLILHQAKNPGKRLTLKCPHHLAWLPALKEALPEALVVQTHRDPITAVPSECKLVLSLHAISTHDLDWRKTVTHNCKKVETFAQRAVEFHDQDDEGYILHLDYKKIVEDPLGLTREVRAHFGLDFDEAQVARTQAFIAENRQHKHGKNTYSMEQFELRKDEINDQFKAYRERFILNGVPAPRRREHTS